MISEKIGFIGAGQMARALARGIVQAGLAEGRQLWACDPAAEARDQFQQMVDGAQVTEQNVQVAQAADLLVLAVKPQQMHEVLAGLVDQVTSRKLVVSIAAGVRLAQLADQLGQDVRLVRVMPNTPCLVGQSASAYAVGDRATDTDAALVDQLLSAVGRAYRVDESLLDAVTGLSGSGPAFVSVFIEALSEGGVRMGLPPEIASALAVQTVLGTADLIRTTGEQPAVIRERVSSPGGTTIAGLEALEAHGFRAAVIAAVEAATRRSMELGDR
ncbi:MAG: pyrroline-5-carboxylate reductase [Planctomycetota bacterium]|nr:pyrroline-5-carboxylate reductase [Planctomycetota bacterium]